MANECVSRERMSEFLAGSLLPEDESQINDHLLGCCDCNRLAFDLSDDPVARKVLAGTANHDAHRGGEALLDDLQRRLAALALVGTSVSDTTALHSGETPSLAANSAAAEDVSARPQRLGKFEIIRELGAGGFGVVYLAKDTVLDRHVALKLPRSIRLVDPGGRQQFFREAQILARLDHPHIVPVYEAGEHDGTCFLVVAYCNGPTLDAWRRQQPEGRADPVAAAQILLILATAVEHAHQQGILHRDIKPTNVLLTAVQAPAAQNGGQAEPAASGILDLTRWMPKVADFGLAKMADVQRSSSTISGTVLGTPDYLSPEQAAGMLDRIGPPTDVYGLGAILYELLAGQPPIHGASTTDTLRRVLLDEPKPLRDLVPAVPRDLAAITRKCLEKSPQLRYQSASELHADLRRFLGGQTVKAPAASAKIGGPWLKSSLALLRRLAIPAMFVALLAAATAALFVGKRQTPAGTLQVEASSAGTNLSVPDSNVPSNKTAIPAPTGLIAWWSGDSNADDLAGHNHGQLINGATFAPGLVGEAFRLDGVDDYVRVSHRDALNPRGAFTIEGWICCDDVPGWQQIISKQNLAQHDVSYHVQKEARTGTLVFGPTEYNAWDLGHIGSRHAIRPATWTHFAATFDTKMMRFFINGARDSEQSVGESRFIHAGKCDVTIGAGEGHTRIDQFFAGLIDELCLYDRALAGDEIRAIYEAGTAGKIKPVGGSSISSSATDSRIPPSLPALNLADPPVPIIAPQGLIAWWSGDGHANDLVGRNHGTTNGGATFGPGKVGQAFLLAGNESYIRVPHSDVLNPKAEFSIECWFQSNCIGSRHIVSKWNMNTGDFSYSLSENGWTDAFAHRFSFALCEHSQMISRFDLAKLEGNRIISPHTWIHVAATFDTATARLYVNGSLDTVQPHTTGRIHAGTTDIRIGAITTGHLSGRVEDVHSSIDELCLYDRALTSKEIEAMYRAGAAGKIKSAIADTTKK